MNTATLLNQEDSKIQDLAIAKAARLSYSPESTIIENCQKWGFSQCHFFDQEAVQGFVATTPSICLVAFRGTNEVADWIANFRVSTSFAFGGRFHSGFVESYENIRRDLLEQIQAWRSINFRQQLWITGHSLGGALSLLAAADLEAVSPIRGVRTFGQPKASDARFANWWTHRIGPRLVRYVNEGDVIARIPPGYQHFGREVRFSRSGTLVETESAFPDLTTEAFRNLRHKCAAETEGSLLFKSHKIDTYIANITNKAVSFA